QEVASCVETSRELLELGRAAQGLFEQLWKPHQRGKVRRCRIRRKYTAHLGEVDREQVERHELAGESFGRGDANLGPDMGIDDAVCLSCRPAADAVSDGTAPGGLALCF